VPGRPCLSGSGEAMFVPITASHGVGSRSTDLVARGLVFTCCTAGMVLRDTPAMGPTVVAIVNIGRSWGAPGSLFLAWVPGTSGAGVGVICTPLVAASLDCCQESLHHKVQGA